MKIALIQMCSSSDIGSNLDKAEMLISHAASKGAEMAVLPESFYLMEKFQGQKLNYVEAHGQGSIQQWMKNLAKDKKIAIVGGTIAVESSEQDRPFARCYVVDEHGNTVSHYDKMHLFDVAVKDDESYSESSHTFPGNHIQLFQWKGVKFGLSVCYDLRFPELYRRYQELGAEVLLVPSAFTYNTGKVHWELLLKARAVENLCFVLAPNQTGIHDNNRKTYGHSMVIGPWGDTIGTLEEDESILVCDVDISQIETLKRRFPVHLHRKVK